MTFPIFEGENTLAMRNGRSAKTDPRVVCRNDDSRQDWLGSLRTPIEIGLVLLRIVEIAMLIA